MTQTTLFSFSYHEKTISYDTQDLLCGKQCKYLKAKIQDEAKYNFHIQLLLYSFFPVKLSNFSFIKNEIFFVA